MTPTGVDQMMSNYLVYKARCAHLKTLIESTELIVAKLHEDQVEDSIRLNALINGMPHAQKGTSDPTGILGSKVASGYSLSSDGSSSSSVNSIPFSSVSGSAGP